MNEGSDLQHQFHALMQQESSCYYRCLDYLSILQSKSIALRTTDDDSDDDSTPKRDVTGVAAAETVANESWREKICEWLYNVVDHFNYSREIVYITMNYLDRYSSVCCQHGDRGTNRITYKLYQLIAVSSLNIVLKMQESKYNHLPLLIELSRKFFTAQHIIAMEMSILKGLSWKLSPPTPLSFVHHMIQLLPRDLEGKINALKESAQFLVELSACDYFFVHVKPSSIAFASLLNSIDRMTPSSTKNRGGANSMKETFVKQVYDLSGLSYSDEVKHCQAKLQEIYQAGGYDNDGFCPQRPLSSPVSTAVVLSTK